jgi:hypothetical protein
VNSLSDKCYYWKALFLFFVFLSTARKDRKDKTAVKKGEISPNCTVFVLASCKRAFSGYDNSRVDGECLHFFVCTGFIEVRQAMLSSATQGGRFFDWEAGRSRQQRRNIMSQQVFKKQTAALQSRVLAVLMAVMLSLGLVPAAALAADAGEGGTGGGQDGTITVYLDFEGYNLGQGFYLEPTALEMPAEATAGEAMELLLNQNGKAFQGGNESNYLEAVAGFDTGPDTVNIPAYITDNGGPTTAQARATGNRNNYLGQPDYSTMSGWMYTVNHEMAAGIGDQILNDGDVLRFQFTVWGYGSDLGLESGWSEPYYIHADKSALIRALFAEGAVESAKQGALEVIIDPLATADAVAAALIALTPEAPPEPPEPPTPPTPTIDKTALEAAIAVAAGLAEVDYTAVTWADVQAALATAQSIAADDDAIQDDVDAATTALNGAIDALERAQADERYTVEVRVALKSASVDPTLSFYKTEGFDAEGYDLLGDTVLPTDEPELAASGNYRTYRLELLPGTYSVRGAALLYLLSEAGAEASTLSIGGTSFTIPSAAADTEAMTDALALVPSNIYTQTKVDGEPLGADDFSVGIVDGAGRPITIGDFHLVSGSATLPGYTALVRAGESYTLTMTPDEGISDYFRERSQSLNISATATASSVNMSFSTVYWLTVPTGADAKVFRQQNNYNLQLQEPATTFDNGDGTTVYQYLSPATAGTWTYRVSMPGKITKAGYIGTEVGTRVQFGADEDPSDTTNTALPTRNESSTLLNIPNADNHLTLGVGDTFRVRGFRAAWQIVDSEIANHMIEPDFHFSILSGSDVVSVTPHETISNWADLTALKAGTAVVEVSYDAIDVAGNNAGRYGATDPQRKAVFVVTVGSGAGGTGAGGSGAGGSGQEGAPSISVPKPSNNDIWDSEFDTWYFLDESEDISVTVSEPGATVTAYNPDYPNSHQTLTGADGSYELTIYPGNNIVTAVKDGKAAHKVIRGAVVVPQVTNVSRPGEEPAAGDTVNIHLSGVFIPIPKMSGIYNPGYGGTAKLQYRASDGTDVTPSTGHQYDFITAHTTTVVIPEDTSEGFGLSGGAIVCGHMGSTLGSHRNITDTGAGTNMSAPALSGVFGVLPDLELVAASELPEPPEPPEPGESVDVTVTFQADDSGFVLAKQEHTVEADLSERYGYVDEYQGAQVTVLDALVAAHITLFTDEDLDEWLALSSFGFAEKVLGDSTASMIYLVNGAMVGDGVYVDDPYNGGTSQTGYAVTQASLSSGDDLVFYLLQDDFFYADNIVWFTDAAGEMTQRIEAKTGEDVLLTLKGYMNWYGYSDAAWQARYTAPIEDAAVVPVTLDDTAGFTVGYFEDSLAVTDEDGEATLSFDTPGTYVLSAIDDSGYEPMASPWLTVEITQAAPPVPAVPAVPYDEELTDALDYLSNTITAPNVGSTAGDWTVLALSRGEYDGVGDAYYEAYYNRVVAYVQAVGSAKLGGNKSSENSRVILVLSALGKDVTKVGGYNLLEPYTDFDWIKNQGINGVIYALLALDASDHEIPVSTLSTSSSTYVPLNVGEFETLDNQMSTTELTRQALIDYILSLELKKDTSDAGGWAMGSQTPDPDLTAMVLQALAPYVNDDTANVAVKAAAERALIKLSGIQRADGGFASWGSVNAESCAQVIVALTALGIDPQTDERFVKEDGNPVTALLSFQVAGGGFKHSATGAVNGMATEQATYALVAYDRLKSGKTSLYNMSDVPASANGGGDDGGGDDNNGGDNGSGGDNNNGGTGTGGTGSGGGSGNNNSGSGGGTGTGGGSGSGGSGGSGSGTGSGAGTTIINNYYSRGNATTGAASTNDSGQQVAEADTVADNGSGVGSSAITDTATPQSASSNPMAREAGSNTVFTPRVIVGIVAFALALALAAGLVARTIMVRRRQNEDIQE